MNTRHHHARNTKYTRSKIKTINRPEERLKNLKHTSIQPNWGENSDQSLAELIHKMQQATMAIENLTKRFTKIIKLN